MAISTDTGKLAVMELEDLWEPGLPLSPGTIGEDDEVQLLWGFPEVLYGAAASLVFVFDINTRLRVFLCDHYGVSASSDLTTLMTRYLAGLSGDMNTRVRQLVSDATDAMS